MIFTRTITPESRMNKAGIYLIRSRTNGKKYVGSSVNINCRVFFEHYPELVKGKHCNILLQNHSNKYGIEDLIFSIIEFCPPVKEKLLERENFYIQLLKPEFNICLVAGSPLGIKRTEENKKNLSIAQIKRYENPEARKRTSLANIKRYENPEARKKMSIAMTGKKYKPMSEQGRRNLSIAAIKRYENPEERERTSIAAIKTWETRRANKAKKQQAKT